MLDSTILKEFVDDTFNLVENGGKFPKWGKNTEGKEKLLVTSNFSFSHNVYKRLVLQSHKNKGLFGKGLTKK